MGPASAAAVMTSNPADLSAMAMSDSCSSTGPVIRAVGMMRQPPKGFCTDRGALGQARVRQTPGGDRVVVFLRSGEDFLVWAASGTYCGYARTIQYRNGAVPFAPCSTSDFSR